jgi:hypothetical protein
MEEQIRNACVVIRNRLRRGNAGRGPTLGEQRSRWANNWVGEAETRDKKAEQKVMHRKWQERWSSHRHSWGLIGAETPSRKSLNIHKGLRKAESSIITQIRIGRIGLAAFLNKIHVPSFDSPTYQCGNANEMAAHIVVHCPLYLERRVELLDTDTHANTPDLRKLCGTATGGQRLAR